MTAAELNEVPTVEAFLAWEAEQPDELHEFAAGRVVRVSSGTARHAQLMLALASQLLGALTDGPCRVYTNARMVRVRDSVRRPDVQVHCGAAADDGYEADAHYLVEILSRSTARTDLVDKANEYKALPSVRQYMVMDPDARTVYLFTRTDLGWHIDQVLGVIRFAGVDVDLPALYDALDRLAPLPEGARPLEDDEG